MYYDTDGKRHKESKISRKARRGGLTIRSRNGVFGEYFRKYKRKVKVNW